MQCNEKIRPREGTKAQWGPGGWRQAASAGRGAAGETESKALVPGPQGRGGAGDADPQPRTEKQEQITIPRKTLWRRGVWQEVRALVPRAQALSVSPHRLHREPLR